MQISPIPNQNFEKPSRNLFNRTKVKIKKKSFWISLKKYLVPRVLSHRGNVPTSKFWRKSKEKKQNFFSKIYEGHIRIWFKVKKSKLFHACVPLKSRLLWSLKWQLAKGPTPSNSPCNEFARIKIITFRVFWLFHFVNVQLMLHQRLKTTSVCSLFHYKMLRRLLRLPVV